MENMRVDEPAASATGRVAAAVDCCPMRAYCGLWHVCNADCGRLPGVAVQQRQCDRAAALEEEVSQAAAPYQEFEGISCCWSLLRMVCIHVWLAQSLINVQFTPNPALKASGATAESSAVSDSGNYWTGSSRGEFVCPVSLQETNGKHPYDVHFMRDCWCCLVFSLVPAGPRRFIVLSTCGHALSAKAMQEVPSQKCLVCSKPFTPLDVVPLCPTSDKQLGVQRGRMRERKAAKVGRDAASLSLSLVW